MNEHDLQRRRRFTRQETLFKALLQREKESKKIRAAIRKLGWKTLEKPIFGGYERYFAIRPDLEAANNALTDDLRKLLPYVQRGERSKTKVFARREPRTRRLIPFEHEFCRVSVKAFLKMDEKLKRHFIKKKAPHGRHYWNGFEWVGAYYYALCKPWVFVSRIRKFYITEVQEHDNVLLQEAAETAMSHLENCVFRNTKGMVVSYHPWRKRFWSTNRQRSEWKEETRKRKKEYFENLLFE